MLVLVGHSLRPYLRLPNLFVPCGSRLQPPLRRDALRQLLAGDADHVTWLRPEQDGTFTPQSLPDNSFRPLSDWVDYVLTHDHTALQSWIAATHSNYVPGRRAAALCLLITNMVCS